MYKKGLRESGGFMIYENMLNLGACRNKMSILTTGSVIGIRILLPENKPFSKQFINVNVFLGFTPNVHGKAFFGCFMALIR